VTFEVTPPGIVLGRRGLRRRSRAAGCGPQFLTGGYNASVILAEAQPALTSSSPPAEQTNARQHQPGDARADGWPRYCNCAPYEVQVVGCQEGLASR
jgi:hypothetical protein